MPDDIDPITWLMAVLDTLGRDDRGRRAERPFNVLRHGDGFVEILHKESGKVWRFDARVLGRGRGGS